MAIRISERDLEMLSTYLDGQLTLGERAQLEARLQTEQELRTALEQIWQAQAAVRNLPFLRAPRNYMLSPKMAGLRKQSPRIYPILGLASALASLLLVLVLIGDLITVRTPGIISLQSVQIVETQMIAVMEAVQTEAALPKSAAPEAETEIIEAPAAGTEEPVLGIRPTEVVEMMAPPPQEPEAAIESLESAAADQVVEPRLQAKAEVSVTDLKPMTMDEQSIWAFLRILEVFFALLALSTGLAALYLYYQSRKSSRIR